MDDPELFAEPLVTHLPDGRIIDGDSLAETPRPGDIVTAKRLGWDEDLSAEQELDLEPYADKGYPSDDLVGVLEVFESPTVTAYLVGGQEADPKTIRPAQ